MTFRLDVCGVSRRLLLPSAGLVAVLGIVGTTATVTPKTLPTVAVAEFATVVESDLPLIVERTMEWDEGATHSGFSLFYLIQNPTETAAQVQVTYLRPAPAAPVVMTYTVAPHSRFNIWVNQVAPALASTDVSAAITSLNGVPIIVERAMYLDRGGQFFGAGHTVVPGRGRHG